MSTVARSLALPSRFLNLLTESERLILLMHIAIFTAVWTLVPWRLIPTPVQVLEALGRLWGQGLGQELYTSFTLNLEALAVSSAIALIFSYSTEMPYFGRFTRPIVVALTKFRFMGLVGWSIAFTLMFGGGHYLKVALMVFGMTGFIITGVGNVIISIPREQFDHARTLRMGKWRIVWEVVILNTLAEVFEVIRQNAAIGWTMLTMVEGISRSEGGIGVMLISQNKFLRLDGIFAIQFTIFILALSQDKFLGLAHKFLFPYAYLKK